MEIQEARKETPGDLGIECLGLLARFHGVAAEPAQLRHQSGLSAPARLDDLLHLARQLPLQARIGPLALSRASEGRTPLPCPA